METIDRYPTLPTDFVYLTEDTPSASSTSDNGQLQLIDEATMNVLIVAFYCVISGVISVLGTVANVINIAVFIKQGVSDTVGISLLSLSVSDMGVLVTAIWMSICFNPWFRYSDIPFESVDIQYLTGGYPHIMFIRITSWITAFITFERCLSIALPMQVKEIITVQRAKLCMVAIFIGVSITISPAFYAIRIAPTFVTGLNKSIYNLVYIPNGREIENVVYAFTIFNQLAPFVPIVVCTVVLIFSLLRQSKWRQKSANISASGDKQAAMLMREKRVVKMVTIISCIFVALLLPSAVNTVPMILLSQEYSISGSYEQIFRIVWGVLIAMEYVNSSVNIFIYYSMSSKYRKILREIFCRIKS